MRPLPDDAALPLPPPAAAADKTDDEGALGGLPRIGGAVSPVVVPVRSTVRSMAAAGAGAVPSYSLRHASIALASTSA